MRAIDALRSVRRIRIPADGPPVERTSAELLRVALGVRSPIRSGGPARGALALSVGGKPGEIRIRLAADGTGEVRSGTPSLLYAACARLLEAWGEEPLARFARGRRLRAPFLWSRPLFDVFLTQTLRSARGLDPERHVERLARLGYTHLEANALASDEPIEEGVPGEFYRWFYAYCPALDQFTESRLTRGLYPRAHLARNLAVLKRNAALGRRYGLAPGLLCFEPRSVPERFYRRYPTLRGPRVDHPFRSHRPRFAMTIAHPAVRAHYAELVGNLAREVPGLSFLSIWTNDSGAGVEHTSSLYVGRNGGAFLIREWNDHGRIAAVAADSLIRWLGTLRDAGRRSNPGFRVILRLEPFKVEHDRIVSGLSRGIEPEVPSMYVRGYELPYAHPAYPDIRGVAGSIHHLDFVAGERPRLAALRRRGIEPHIVGSHSVGWNLEPLVGIPHPWMVHASLRSRHARGVRQMAHLGGDAPPDLAPYDANGEVLRAFQLDPGADLESALRALARRWAGPHADDLLSAWRDVDAAVRVLPRLPLYSVFGFVWARLWVRPLVPDLLAIPAAERVRYERNIVTTANNPNLADLGRDVLFRVFGPGEGRRFAQRADRRVFPILRRAIARCDRAAEMPGAPGVFADLGDRLRGLACWTETMRSTAVWVWGVHGWTAARDGAGRRRFRGILDRMMDREIVSTRALLSLWETSRIPWIAVARVRETPFAYGPNLGDLLRRKIRLMERYRGAKPNLHPDLIWRL